MQGSGAEQVDSHRVISSSHKILRSTLLLIAGVCLFFVVASAFFILASSCMLYYLGFFPAKTIVDSLFAFLALVIPGAYLGILVPLKIYLREFSPSRRMKIPVVWRKIRKITLKTVVLICSATLMTTWLWADIVDGLFAALFVIFAHLYRIRFLNPRHIHGWILVFLTVGFVFLVNCDKVADPDYDDAWYYAAEWLCWAVIACYFMHLALLKRHKPWKWLVAALLIWLLPITELPGEITRQLVGWSLTGRMEGLHFTKIRPDRIYALEIPPWDRGVEVYRRQSNLSYQYDTKEFLMDGGGVSSWIQIPRTPLPFLRLRTILEGKRTKARRAKPDVGSY